MRVDRVIALPQMPYLLLRHTSVLQRTVSLLPDFRPYMFPVRNQASGFFFERLILPFARRGPLPCLLLVPLLSLLRHSPELELVLFEGRISGR